MQFSLESVRDVARLLHETELAEITVEDTDAASGETFRVVMKRNTRAAASTSTRRATTGATSSAGASTASTSTQASAPTTAEGSAATPQGITQEAESPAPEPTGITITSTAVGLFRQPSPPVQAGDMVKPRQVVAIVESLKIPNEITTRVAGRVEELLVTEGQGVEYGQPLLIIHPEDA
jgi:acetyl-CoA carboxylase biotin carboxyl carrier protein